MAKEDTKKKRKKSFDKRLIDEMLKLSTAGFGLAAALAWNEFIQRIFDVYLTPLTGEAGNVLSLGIYAIVVSSVAVFITYNLSALRERKEQEK